jgi:hypothetical protein
LRTPFLYKIFLTVISKKGIKLVWGSEVTDPTFKTSALDGWRYPWKIITVTVTV